MKLLQYTSILIDAKNHLMRVSQPFRHISKLLFFLRLAVSITSFFIMIFRFCAILGVMEPNYYCTVFSGLSVFYFTPHSNFNVYRFMYVSHRLHFAPN